MQAVLKLMSKGLEVDADIIEVDVVGRLLFIVLGQWQGSDLTKNVNILPISLGGPMGTIYPVWGHVLVSFIICFTVVCESGTAMQETFSG